MKIGKGCPFENMVSLIGFTSDREAVRSLSHYMASNIKDFILSIKNTYSNIIRDSDGLLIDLCKNNPNRTLRLEVPCDDSILMDDILKYNISWIYIGGSNNV